MVIPPAHPDPSELAAVHDISEFAALLQKVKIATGLPLREIEERGPLRGKGRLTRSLVGDFLNGHRLPTPAQLHEFLQVCGVNEQDILLWERTRVTLAAERAAPANQRHNAFPLLRYPPMLQLVLNDLQNHSEARSSHETNRAIATTHPREIGEWIVLLRDGDLHDEADRLMDAVVLLRSAAVTWFLIGDLRGRHRPHDADRVLRRLLTDNSLAISAFWRFKTEEDIDLPEASHVYEAIGRFASTAVISVSQGGYWRENEAELSKRNWTTMTDTFVAHRSPEEVADLIYRLRELGMAAEEDLKSKHEARNTHYHSYNSLQNRVSFMSRSREQLFDSIVNQCPLWTIEAIVEALRAREIYPAADHLRRKIRENTGIKADYF